jgi:hypothetical protein
MSHTILCARSGCNAKFRPKGNQQYCTPECSAEARRVQNRRAKRRQRFKQFLERCQELAQTRPPPGEVSADRNGPTLFAYRCDHCHRVVLRPARQLFVFCHKSCRQTFRRARRRLVRRFLKQFKNRCDPFVQLLPSRGPQILSSPTGRYDPTLMSAPVRDREPVDPSRADREGPRNRDPP